MKKTYLAIGHWAEEKTATFSVAMRCNSIKDFRKQLAGNGFVPYVVITENKMNVLRSADEFGLYDEVKKLTGNYRKWNHICDYIEQCWDIMEEKMMNA